MFVTEDLLHSEGFTSHPVPRGRGKGRRTGRQRKQWLRPLQKPGTPSPPPVLPASPLSLSAPWQLACQESVSPSPLEFPVSGNRGNGPFGTIYRNKVTAAISPGSSRNATCSERGFWQKQGHLLGPLGRWISTGGPGFLWGGRFQGDPDFLKGCSVCGVL